MHFFSCQSVINHMTTKIRRLSHILENYTFGCMKTATWKKSYGLTGKLMYVYLYIFAFSVCHSSILFSVLRQNVFLSRLKEKIQIPKF